MNILWAGGNAARRVGGGVLNITWAAEALRGESAAGS